MLNKTLKIPFALVSIVCAICVIGMVLSKSILLKVVFGILYFISAMVMNYFISSKESIYDAYMKILSTIKIKQINTELVGKEVPIEESGIVLSNTVFNMVDNTTEDIFRVVNSLLERANTYVIFDRVISYLDYNNDNVCDVSQIITMSTAVNRIKILPDAKIIDISAIIAGIVNESTLNNGYSIEIIRIDEGFKHRFYITKQE